ncbi:MAG: hypothetical protein AABM42_01875 [Actinomycetota bacterium]
MTTTEEATMPTQPTVPGVRRDEPVTVKPLDTVNIPDAAENEREEVVCLVDSFEQILNARFAEAKHRVGVDLDLELFTRTRGDRFWLDVRDLPRLLQIGGVATPEQLTADDDLDAEAAELEARRAEVERERVERREKLRRRLGENAERLAMEAREREVSRAGEAQAEADAEVARTE